MVAIIKGSPFPGIDPKSKIEQVVSNSVPAFYFPFSNMCVFWLCEGYSIWNMEQMSRGPAFVCLFGPVSQLPILNHPLVSNSPDAD